MERFAVVVAVEVLNADITSVTMMLRKRMKSSLLKDLVMTSAICSFVGVGTKVAVLSMIVFMSAGGSGGETVHEGGSGGE